MGIFDGLFKPNVERLQEKKNVKGLIKALRHKDSDVRWRAAKALGEIGDKRAVEPLIQALKDKDRDVRKEAVWTLGRIGDKRAVEPLIQALKDEYWDVRERAAKTLVKIGEPAVEPLIQALKDEDRYVREGAAEALGKMGWKPGDDTEKVYYLIAKRKWSELPKLGEPAVEPLIQALKDEDRRVQLGAAKALGEIGDERAVEPLIQTLKDKTYWYPVDPLREAVRWEAAEALQKITGIKILRWEAVETLEKIIKIMGIGNKDNGN